MFRLYDTRTGRAEEIDPGPGKLLRLYARGPAPHRPANLGELRSLLVADLIRRNAEHRHDLTVAAYLVIPDTGNGDDRPADDGAFAADAIALNIRPAEQVTGASAGTGALEPGEIIIDARPAAGQAAMRNSVRTGPVTFEDSEPVSVAGLADRGLDPLAARLALMSSRYAEPANLTWDVLGGADQDLRRWRELVAGWAESPSKPMCAEVTAQVAAAFDGDLDTPMALQALRALADDPQIPPGSKFESFVHADQLLALDLPREIGRPRRG